MITGEAALLPSGKRVPLVTTPAILRKGAISHIDYRYDRGGVGGVPLSDFLTDVDTVVFYLAAGTHSHQFKLTKKAMVRQIKALTDHGGMLSDSA